MTDEQKVIKLAKENSFLRARLLLKDEIRDCLKLLNMIEPNGIVCPKIEAHYDKLSKRNNNTDHIFKICGERI